VLPLPTEGWGATILDGALVVSDGSDRIAFYNPNDMKLLGSLAVTDEGAPVTALNELEVVGGMLWANIWHDTRIAVIAPASGRVVAWVDCAALARPQLAVDPENVLNGIACDPATGRVWVTGKNWSVIHQIDVPGLPLGAPLP
jgi:glutamine cyclotransferase